MEDARPVSLAGFDPRDFDKWAVFRAIGYEPDEWQRLFHESTAKHRILACGVRVGKTYCLAAEAVAATICPSPVSTEKGEWVGSRVWIVAPNYDAADKLFKITATYIRRHFGFLVTSYSEHDRILRTIGGGYLQAKSATNPESLASEELDAAIVDEAPKIGEFEKEQVRERLLTRRGWFAAIGSPIPCAWFERDFVLGQGLGFRYEFEGEPMPGCKVTGMKVRFVKGTGDPDARYFSVMVPTHANPRLDLDDLASNERTTPDRIFRQDYLAEFMGDKGRVFHDFERLFQVPAEADDKQKMVLAAVPGHTYIVGWDVARTKDWSVLSIIDYATREQVFLDRFQGPWESQYARVVKVLRRYARPDLIIDATGKGDPVVARMVALNSSAAERAVLLKTTVEEEERRGPFALRIEGVEFYGNSLKRQVVEQLAMGFDQALLRILPNYTQAQELRLYEFKQSDATGIIRYGAPPGFHDDCVMALAVAFWRATRPRGSGHVRFG